MGQSLCDTLGMQLFFSQLDIENIFGCMWSGFEHGEKQMGRPNWVGVQTDFRLECHLFGRLQFQNEHGRAEKATCSEKRLELRVGQLLMTR